MAEGEIIGAIVLLVLATILEFVSLWQIEIVSWNTDENFEFPFFAKIVNKWVARDFWYAVQIIGWILTIVAAAYLGKLLL